MVKSIKYFIILFFLIILPSILCQDKEQIKNKKNELTRIKEEISSLESQLKIKNIREKQSYSALENYNKQNFLLNKLLNQLRDEEQLKQKEIDSTLNQVAYLEMEIQVLRNNYSKYVVSVYKKGKDNEMFSLLDSESMQQALVRYKYLQRFSERRKKDLDLYQKNRHDLIALKEQYRKEKDEKTFLAGQKDKEEKDLHVKLDERKKVLVSIRHDKVEIKKSIDAKLSAESKIKNIIARLIEEEERKRKEEQLRLSRLAEENVKKGNKSGSVINEKKPVNQDAVYDINLSTSGFSSFSSLKGRLNWPIAGGQIIRHFGENKNTKLNTITMNYGVDIKASKDLNVKTAADGVISAIDWIPGYGTVIIITHKDGYRTVYSHLSEIFVKEGDKVKFGSVIAKIGESIEGNIVHFEIWNSRINQNPELWLARK
jgi:septal ring factor EnvC (AmiA/AmiB activator)